MCCHLWELSVNKLSVVKYSEIGGAVCIQRCACEIGSSHSVLETSDVNKYMTWKRHKLVPNHKTPYYHNVITSSHFVGKLLLFLAIMARSGVFKHFCHLSTPCNRWGVHKNTSNFDGCPLERMKEELDTLDSCAATLGENPSRRKKVVGSACRVVGRSPTGTSRRRMKHLQKSAQARRRLWVQICEFSPSFSCLFDAVDARDFDSSFLKVNFPLSHFKLI